MINSYDYYFFSFSIASMVCLELGDYLRRKRDEQKRSQDMSGNEKKSESIACCLVFVYFVFCPMRHSPSMLVFGMVLTGWSILFFSPISFFLTAVTKLISIIRTEISIAPNVELMRGHRDFSEHNETNDQCKLL